jgi:hypothetical protein
VDAELDVDAWDAASMDVCMVWEAQRDRARRRAHSLALLHFRPQFTASLYRRPIPCDLVTMHSGSVGFVHAVVVTRFSMSDIVFIFPLADCRGKPNESGKKPCRRII